MHAMSTAAGCSTRRLCGGAPRSNSSPRCASFALGPRSPVDLRCDIRSEIRCLPDWSVRPKLGAGPVLRRIAVRQRPPPRLRWNCGANAGRPNHGGSIWPRVKRKASWQQFGKVHTPGVRSERRSSSVRWSKRRSGDWLDGKEGGPARRTRELKTRWLSPIRFGGPWLCRTSKTSRLSPGFVRGN
jgi:hypothetical protein